MGRDGEGRERTEERAGGRGDEQGGGRRSGATEAPGDGGAPGPARRAAGGPPRAVRTLRSLRSLHGWVSLALLVLVVVSSVTGLLLAWKKNSDTLQPPTRGGEAVALDRWRPLDQLGASAVAALADHLGTDDPARLQIDRLDVRPGDGVVKVLFPGAWEVQVAGATAEVRSVARRHSDWIEKLHDGSLIGDGFKLLAMTVLGLGLIALSISGFWMWYGPRRLRRARRRPASAPSRRAA